VLPLTLPLWQLLLELAGLLTNTWRQSGLGNFSMSGRHSSNNRWRKPRERPALHHGFPQLDLRTARPPKGQGWQQSVWAPVTVCHLEAVQAL